MKKLFVAGVLSTLAFVNLSAEKLELDDLSSNWKGSLGSFQSVDGKGIDGGSAIEFGTTERYKKLVYGEKISVEQGKRMTATIDFKAEFESGAPNKSFFTVMVAPNPHKNEGRVTYGMSNGKKGFSTSGYLPRWSMKFLQAKALGMSSNAGATPWLRMVVTIENQKKKIASKATLYSLGVDGKDEPKVIVDNKLKRKSKKGEWKSETDWGFCLGSGEIGHANTKEVVVSKIDVTVADI